MKVLTLEHKNSNCQIHVYCVYLQKVETAAVKFFVKSLSSYHYHQ